MNTDDDNEPVKPGKSKQLSVVPGEVLLAKRSLVTRTLDRVVPEKSKFLGLLWILALVAIVALFSNIQGKATQFYGIAEGRQQSISFQYPVEIVAVPVVEGEQVAKNATLLQVRRYDLDVELAVINEKINEIRAEYSANQHNAHSEIASLQAESLARAETLNTRINSLASKYRLHQRLAGTIIGDSSGEVVLTDNPMQTQLDGLRAEKRQLGRMYQARIELQQQKLADITGPGEARIAELVQQKNELLRQSKALVVGASFSGSVGSVMFKPGEQVDAFRPIISIHGASTRHIKGYIHEAVINDIRIGQPVWIKTLGATRNDRMNRGVVESLGSRIVEYPQRLKRSLMVSAWGREAVIRVAEDNKILLGEKVSVLLHKPKPLLDPLLVHLEAFLPISEVRAWIGEDGAANPATPKLIQVQIENLSAEKIEASGIAWNPQTQSYLLISDEQAALFNFSPKGILTDRYALDSSEKIDDLESISRDGFNYYVAASLSHNQKQKLKSKRRKLMRFQLNDKGIEGSDSIDLYAVLQGLIEHQQLDQSLRNFIADGVNNKTLELEAHSVIDNSLYLGFKSPFDVDGYTVFLKLKDVDALFAGKAVEVSMWMKLKLVDLDSGIRSRLTDFVLDESAVFLLSVGTKDDQAHSFFWRYEYASQRLHKITEFHGLQAEGLSIDLSRGIATIVFDGGGRMPSQFLHRRI